jgi:hypothetical protein
MRNNPVREELPRWSLCALSSMMILICVVQNFTTGSNQCGTVVPELALGRSGCVDKWLAVEVWRWRCS